MGTLPTKCHVKGCFSPEKLHFNTNGRKPLLAQVKRFKTRGLILGC